MNWRTVDMSRESRRDQFAYFQTLSNPYVGVTVQVDVTELAVWCRESGTSFFLAVLYAAVRAANGVPELRQRIRGDQVVEYDRCPSSHTVALPDGTYCYCSLEVDRPFREFLPYAAAEQERVKAAPNLEDGEDGESLFFVSCVPWLSYTALTQPTPTPADSNPRITWGRWHRQEGRTLLPMTLLANHALVDGIHIARFYENLDRELAAAKTRSELSLIEVKCSIGAREDLGRPTTTARENKEGFMDYLRGLE